jgi:hypothetical protein
VAVTAQLFVQKPIERRSLAVWKFVCSIERHCKLRRPTGQYDVGQRPDRCFGTCQVFETYGVQAEV